MDSYNRQTIKSHNITLHGRNNQYVIELEPLTDDHLPILYQWNTYSHVLYWCEGDDVVSNDREAVHTIYGKTSQNAYLFLIRVEGTPIGECWLQKMNIPDVIEQHPNVDIRRIDITIFEKDYWGKGFGSTIIDILKKFAFEDQKVDLLYCFIEDYNIRSQRCFLKSRFRFIKEVEHEETSKGRFELHYALSREEYALIEHIL